MKRLAILAALSLLALPAAACAQTAAVAEASVATVRVPGLAEALASIHEADFYRRVGLLAHDSMLGRATPSPGLEMASLWIAREFERFGLKPGGEGGSFLQRYTIQQVAPDYEGSRVRVGGGGELVFGRDLGFLRTPVGEEEAAGPVLLLAGEAELSEADRQRVRGAHLVFIPPLAAGELAGRALLRSLEGVLQAGPASLLVMTRQGDEEWDRTQEVQRVRPQTRVPWEEAAMPPLLTIREGSLERLLAARGVDLERVASSAGLHPAAGLEIALAPRARLLGEFSAPNVVGILEGSDPLLRHEYVVYSAHSDHVGVGRPDQRGDSIYNGADDNASGTALVVEIAEAFSLLPQAPLRSILFVLVSGEERGLWGGSYFTAFPPAPVEDMVANLNADMVGRNWPDTIVAIGKEHSELGETLARVNAAYPELNMTAIDDRWPEQNFYFRSDHVHFARKGVPALFFFNGVHEDYHRPSDEVERIDAEKAARITRLLFLLGLEVANTPERPRWNPESYRQIVEGGREQP